MLTKARHLRLTSVSLTLVALTCAAMSLLAADPSPALTPPQSTSALDRIDPADLLNAPVDQPPTPPPTPTPVTRTQNVTINLINRLVERGVLTKQDAAELIQMAEEDAAAAKADAAQAQATQAPPPPSDDTVRVTYVPEVVKKQIKEELRQEVMDQARDENWAAPRTFPEWAQRFRFFADLRVRYEGDFFPSGNDNTGAFPNFNAINTGPPFDVHGTLFSPQIDVDQDRERFRLRARF